ncbi:NAD-glutamate dehydrogenase, partial [Achromatium sp. WMS1]
KISFQERSRLFKLPKSSWADYDRTLISKGGGIYSRQLKSISLSPEVQLALNCNAKALTPADLVRAILQAPVDLLWSGGIGTYVKASWERHADVGDRINDAQRINARELRCRSIGEGGNLGLTQAARIEYAQQGGRLDTDFIHNVGGVNCSDHEVNIKILLNQVVAAGELELDQRNELLAQMTEEIATLVLQDSYWQGCAISLDEARSTTLLPEHTRFIRYLEQSGRLNRVLEGLPSEKELKRRQRQQQGLTRPEIAVLIAYAKHNLYEDLLASDLPEDIGLLSELERYFPYALRTRFQTYIHNHPLRREILCTIIANRLVNRFGSTFVFRLQEIIYSPIATIVRTITVIWEIFALSSLWSLAPTIPTALRLNLLNRAGQLVGR